MHYVDTERCCHLADLDIPTLSRTELSTLRFSWIFFCLSAPCYLTGDPQLEKGCINLIVFPHPAWPVIITLWRVLHKNRGPLPSGVIRHILSFQTSVPWNETWLLTSLCVCVWGTGSVDCRHNAQTPCVHLPHYHFPSSIPTFDAAETDCQ